MEWRRNEYSISTDPTRIDFGVIHTFVTRAYWSPGIPREVVEQAARHSLVFGLYHDSGDGAATHQVGYARVLTDYTALAYVMDVFVLEAHRGRGLATWLMETIISHPELQEVRSWLLKTRDAHGLYARIGFSPLPDPERFMCRTRHLGYAGDAH